MIYVYICTACAGDERKNKYRGSYVCPWCGDGVMQLEEEIEEDEDETDDPC
jgi:predicted RNA-binding Zn-ribbon protein involved in translation (DUF1610 family)